jgi:hypothetical protein
MNHRRVHYRPHRSPVPQSPPQYVEPELSVPAIRVAAYLLWEAAGCPPDRDWEFWFAAERSLKFRDSP